MTVTSFTTMNASQIMLKLFQVEPSNSSLQCIPRECGIGASDHGFSPAAIDKFLWSHIWHLFEGQTIRAVQRLWIIIGYEGFEGVDAWKARTPD